MTQSVQIAWHYLALAGRRRTYGSYDIMPNHDPPAERDREEGGRTDDSGRPYLIIAALHRALALTPCLGPTPVLDVDGLPAVRYVLAPLPTGALLEAWVGLATVVCCRGVLCAVEVIGVRAAAGTVFIGAGLRAAVCGERGSG